MKKVLNFLFVWAITNFLAWRHMFRRELLCCVHQEFNWFICCYSYPRLMLLFNRDLLQVYLYLQTFLRF